MRARMGSEWPLASCWWAWRPSLRKGMQKPEQASSQDDGFAFGVWIWVAHLGGSSQSMCLHWAWCSRKRFFLLTFCFFGINFYLKASLLPTGWFSGHPQTPSLLCAWEGSFPGASLLSTSSTSGFGPQAWQFCRILCCPALISLALPFCAQEMLIRQGLP